MTGINAARGERKTRSRIKKATGSAMSSPERSDSVEARFKSRKSAGPPVTHGRVEPGNGVFCTRARSWGIASWAPLYVWAFTATKAACQSGRAQCSIIVLPSLTSVTWLSPRTTSSRALQAASASACGTPLESQTMAVGKASAVEKFLTRLIRTVSEGVPFMPLSVLRMWLAKSIAKGTNSATTTTQSRSAAQA